MKTNCVATHSRCTHHLPRLIALGLLALLLLGGLARSRAQSANQPAPAASDTYALVSVDGKKVPCTIDHEGTAMQVHSGTFTVTTNGQVTSVMIISVGDKKNVRIERTATYTEKNSELTMKWQNFGMTKGQIAGNTFTMTNEGMAYVYKK